MKPYSLLKRIALGLSAIVMVACVCGVSWLFFKAKWADNSLREQALLVQARDIARHIEIAANNSVNLHLPPSLAEAYARSESRYQFAIRDADGQYLISNSGHLGALPDLNGKKHRLYGYDTGQRHPHHVVGAALRAQVGGRPLYVQVEQLSENASPLVREVLEEFLVDGDWLEFLFLFALIGVCLFIVDRGLRPLRRISRIAQSIGPANAHIRFPTKDAPAEILPCVLSLNEVLDRLEEGLDRQREFNANVAHQLRTPLAALLANVQSLDDPALAERLEIDVEHMGRIISQLLTSAKMDALSIDPEEIVELNGLVADVAANLGPLAINAGKSIELERSADEIFIQSSSFALQTALQNLIENAIKYTPAGTSVRLKISDLPAVSVTDSGPGIPEALRSKIFGRFWRDDKSSEGAGLGLAIVDKIVRTIKGEISITDAPGGGACFTISLPAAALVDSRREEQSHRTTSRAVLATPDGGMVRLA